MTDISLHIPQFCELWYRQKILSDAETMSYNAGYNLGFEGYDNDTGCIDFPESDWADWYNYFCKNPNRFYAYIVANGGFIGEVNLHKAGVNIYNNTYNMGIVIEAKHRGKGYAVPALKLLLKQAFEVMDAEAVINDFEDSRSAHAAEKTHKHCGFEEVEKKDGITVYKITKRKYLQAKT